MEHPMKTKLLRLSMWLLAFALLAASLIGANLIMNSHAGDATPKADSQAAPAPGNDSVVCIGHIDVGDSIRNLYPVQPGKVAEVLVREDQEVKKDAVLFRLDDRPAHFLLR